MKRTSTTLAALLLLSSPTWAFDFGSLISETVKNVATNVAKESAKSAARSQGIENADQLIDAAAAARTAPGTVGQAQALKGIAGSGPLGTVNAALAAQDMARRAGNGAANGQYSAEYLAIQQQMQACQDLACIRAHQQRLQALQYQAPADNRNVPQPAVNAAAGNAVGNAVSKGIGGAVGNLIGTFGFGK